MKIITFFSSFFESPILDSGVAQLYLRLLFSLYAGAERRGECHIVENI